MTLTRDRVTHESELLARIAQTRVAKCLADLDYQRELVFGADAGLSQRAIAEALHVSQPTVSAVLRTARKVVRPIRPGFSGASPYEIAQRFSIGSISREALIDQLLRWPYAPTPATDGVDPVLVDEGDSWLEVEQAWHNGLISDELYDHLLERLEEAESGDASP